MERAPNPYKSLFYQVVMSIGVIVFSASRLFLPSTCAVVTMGIGGLTFVAGVVYGFRVERAVKQFRLHKLRHYGEKTTKLLALAISISVLALFAAGFVGWMIINH